MTQNRKTVNESDHLLIEIQNEKNVQNVGYYRGAIRRF